MRAVDYIKQRYYIAKSTFDQIYEKDNSYEENKTHNYIATSTDIGYFLIQLQQSKCNEEVDRTDRLFRFEEVLDDLLHNCILEKITPKLKLYTKEGYGFYSFPFENDLMRVLQFHEDYLKAATPVSDVIHWIELGVKLNIINVTIEIK